MRFFQLILNNQHLIDHLGRPYVFDSKDSALDFAKYHGIRYDNVPEVCIMPVSHIKKLEGGYQPRPSPIDNPAPPPNKP